MRPPVHAGRRPVELNMTPMIDVVFLLIIFFLVSSHLARQETQLDLDLPAAGGDEPAASIRPRITINVLPTGQTLLGGAATPIDQIEQRLAYEQSRTGRGVEVRIRGDRSAPYRAIEPLLVACARAGVWGVSFAVFDEP